MTYRTDHRGGHFARSSKRRLARAIHIEGLEERCLFTIYNPLIVPIAALPTEGVSLGASNPVVATFASPAASIADLFASVAFPSGTTTTTITSTGASESIPGVGNVPEYQVNYAGNWTPPDESPGVAFTVTITDSTVGTGNTTSLHGATPVRDAPLSTFSSLPSQTVVEGAATDFSPLTFTDTNPNSTAADFTATIDWGDGSPQSEGVVTKNGSNFDVTGTHAYLESSTLHVLVTDKGGATVASTSTITVNDAGLTNGIGRSFTGNEGQTLSGVLLGSFDDANPSGDPSDFIATLNWGDGAPVDLGEVRLLGGTTGAASFGIFGNHTYRIDSTTPFNVTINVVDKGGSTLPTINSTATISDPLLIMAGGYKVSAVEGKSTGTQTVATFIDPGGNDSPASYPATVDWGDGTTSAGTVTFANGFFSVSGAHTYAKARSIPYVITTTITHVPGIPQSVISSATITKAPLAGSAVTIHGFEGRSATVNVANFTAPTATSAGDFTASINWGDGKTTTGAIVKDASGKYHVAGAHAYAEESSSLYALKVTIKQSGGATINVNSNADIDDSPLDQAAGVSFSVSKNSTFSNKTLGTFRDQDALNKIAGDYDGTIDWGDGKTSTAAFVFNGSTSNVGSFWKVTGGHKYTTAKTFTVKITIDDSGSPSKKTTITTTIKVT